MRAIKIYGMGERDARRRLPYHLPPGTPIEVTSVHTVVEAVIPVKIHVLRNPKHGRRKWIQMYEAVFIEEDVRFLVKKYSGLQSARKLFDRQEDAVEEARVFVKTTGGSVMIYPVKTPAPEDSGPCVQVDGDGSLGQYLFELK